MDKFSITIPRYPTKIQTSASRRTTYYTSIKDIPKKYQTMRYSFKNGKLYDNESRMYVAKNERSKGTPRYVAISGNNLYSRMHERVRMKVMYELKKAMRPHLPKNTIKNLIGLPVKVTMKVYRTVSNGGWDLDNFNIFYFKAFFDLLRDEGIIPDDSIQFIVAVGSEFIPISNDENRKLVFEFTQSKLPEITGHLLYKDEPTDFINGNCAWNINLVKSLDTGRLMIDYGTKTYNINVGKKFIVWNALKKVLTSIAVHALIINEPVNVSEQLKVAFESQLRDILFSHRIPVYVNKIRENEWVTSIINKTK